MASLTEVVQESIRQSIIACELRPGQVVTAAELAAQYECSATPIREALRALTQDRLVRPIPRLGYRVLPIALKDIVEIFTLRQRLEELAAELAARNGSEKDLRELYDLVTLDKADEEDIPFEDFKWRNRAFHIGIAQASGNARLVRMLRPLLHELDRLYNLGVDFSSSLSWMKEDHDHLARALVDRDAELAARLAGQHITETKDEIFRVISTVGGRGLQLYSGD